MENWAWRFFVEMQLSGLEVEEIRRVDMEWQTNLDQASLDRKNKILELAELRAEKLEGHPWNDWLCHFKRVVWPEFTKPVQVQPPRGSGSSFLWDWKIKSFNEYREQEAKH